MADTKEIDLSEPLLGQVINMVPSPLKPYAKALVAAVPPVLTAWAVLQSGDVTTVSVLQFIVAVLTVAGVYLVPLTPDGKWESGLKVGVAVAGAAISAGLAAFGDGGPQGWIGFGSAALAAILVGVVDNVPNAQPAIAATMDAMKQTADNYASQVHSAGSVTLSAPAKVTYGENPGKSGPATPPLPVADEVDPEG